MSDTNSLHSLEQTDEPARSADTPATKAVETAGHTLFERIGVGGMGEVYRCGERGAAT